MPRPSNKEKLLADGLRLVHERGFGASSVRDITQAAGVPQGSFTNHFASKEAFGLEILERYRAMTSAAVRATLRNDRLPPLDRLRAWIEGQLSYLRKDDMRRGCLYGNLSAEASEEFWSSSADPAEGEGLVRAVFVLPLFGSAVFPAPSAVRTDFVF